MTCITPVSPPVVDFLDLVDTAVASVSRRLPSQVARDDLASVGKLALVVALEQCDGPRREMRAYCYVRVRGAILDELRRLDPLTRRQRALARTIAESRVRLAHRGGGDPAIEDIARDTGLSTFEIDAVRAAQREPEEPEWGALPDTAGVCPAVNAEQTDLLATLLAALERLPANQALALRRYYLEDGTLDDIAADLGVSRERARQVREAGQKNLRSDFIVLAAWEALIAGGCC